MAQDHSVVMDYKILLLVLTSLTTSVFADVNITNPGEGLYDIEVEFPPNSNCQNYHSLCPGIARLNYQQCAVLTTTGKDCENPATIRVSFAAYRPQAEVEGSLINFRSHEGTTITRIQVKDVNECDNRMNKCSVNGYCTNANGTYRCECGFGYRQPDQSTAPAGTYCVKRCINRSCRNGGTCTIAADESSEVACDCPPSYTGSICQNTIVTKQLPDWGVILIAIVAAIAACIGIGLCAYTCYRLFYKKSGEDDFSDTNSIYSFKPKSIPTGEYDRIVDIGSVGRSNRGYASTIDEESEQAVSASVKNDGLRFGTRLTSSRLSIPSEHGDPTPVLNPYTQTDRHAVSDIISNPDYY